MYTIKPLDYDYNALEPYISEYTLETHYNKHYKKYLENLNNLLIKNNYDFKYSKEELVSNINIFPISDRGAILFNLGGVLNHELYFQNLGLNNTLKPFLPQIIKQYGSLENFKDEYINNTKTLIGSGYTFLVLNKANELEIINTSNQDTPYSYGLIPVMNIDLWEHAYYLDYQNFKDEYINNFFQLLFNNLKQ